MATVGVGVAVASPVHPTPAPPPFAPPPALPVTLAPAAPAAQATPPEPRTSAHSPAATFLADELAVPPTTGQGPPEAPRGQQPPAPHAAAAPASSAAEEPAAPHPVPALRHPPSTDPAYAAVVGRRDLDDVSGSLPDKLDRAYRALGGLCRGVAGVFPPDFQSASVHELRKRLIAQSIVLTSGSKAEKLDSMGTTLWQLHPWDREAFSMSDFFRELPAFEAEVETERHAVGALFHEPVRVRVLADWHASTPGECARCSAARAAGAAGDEHCPVWPVLRNMIAFRLPLATAESEAKLERSPSAQSPPSAAEASVISASISAAAQRGFVRLVPAGTDLTGSVYSNMFVVNKRLVALDAETSAAAATGDTATVAAAGLARGESIARRASEIAVAAGRASTRPASLDFARAASEVSGDTDSARVVLDLTGSGVNAATADFAHSLPSVHNHTDWEATDHQAVLDVVKGYHALRVDTAARRCFRFRHPVTGEVYEFCRVVMGGKISGSIFCCLSGMLARRFKACCESEGLRVAVWVYIDDFLLRAHRDSMGRVLTIVEREAAAAAVSFNAAKRQVGRRVVYCGAVLDSDENGTGPSISAKPEHIFAFCEDIGAIRYAAQSGGRVPVSFFERAAGIGHFLSGFVAAIKPRLGPLSFAAGHWGSGSMLQANRDGIPDAVEWLAARAARGLRVHRRFTRDEAAAASWFISDASGADGQGAGAIFGNEAIYRPLERCDCRGLGTDAEAAATINIELDPLIAGIEHWGSKGLLRDRLIVVANDNFGVACCVAKQCGKRGSVAAERITALYDLADKYGCELISLWLPRVFNRACDTLSKQSSLAAAQAALRAIPGFEGVAVSQYERFTGCR